MIALLLWSCSGAPTVETAAAPQPTGLAECAVCGMVAREQPAPRAQIERKDGTHEFFCSIGDMRADLAAPSPHGSAVGIWVEALPPGFDPAAPAGPELPWISAESASYVVGRARPGTMGRPVLSYADRATAEAEAAEGHVVDWASLVATPFDQDP